MNKLWSCICLFAVVSVGCVGMTLLSVVIQLCQVHSAPMASFGSLGLIAYLIGVSALIAWILNIVIDEFVQHTSPLSLRTIKSYITMAKEVGMLTKTTAGYLLREPGHKQKLRHLDSNLDLSSEEQQMRDKMQCELELLLNELHRLLIASWFDQVSPKDPDFPRATRQALSKIAFELQTKASSIEPCEAAQIILMLINSHLHKVQNNLYDNSVSPVEDGSAAQLLEMISEALVSSLTFPEINSAFGGKLLSSLLAHGALLRALTVVSNPGWLSFQVAQAIAGETIVNRITKNTEHCDEKSITDTENLVQNETPHNDIESESAVQEACTPPDDTSDFLMWPTDLHGRGPRLWGTCSLQPEQPSLPQIIEPSNTTTPTPVMRKASEAEWLNPSPPRQNLGLQLSKSSQDLRQVSKVQFPAEDLKNIRKELSLGSFVRGETSLLGHKMREAGSDVLGSLRARATSHLSALLSPARESSIPPTSTSRAEFLLDPGEGEDEVSPVYEEASDLATSIAKLRAFLQHHDPKSSTDDEESPALQSTESQPEHQPMWDNQREIDASDFEWMEAEEAPELPNDGRPIMNISIPATELSCDTDGQQYVQYCIQYDAVYVQDGVDGPRLVLQTAHVKRRFQEFLNLQNRLEENPHYRTALRAVKGPSKWLSLAFSKAGHQTTAARLPVLERFLQQLCEQPILARSPVLRQFLAYGSEHAIAFSKRETTDLPRLDKIFARTVSGVFHSIKTALPSFDFDLTSPSHLQQLQHNMAFNTEEGRTSTLPGLLSFVSNRTIQRPNQPLSFMEKIPQGNDISRDIQKFLASRVETASDALIDETAQRTGIPIRDNSLRNLRELNRRSVSLTSLIEELFQLLFPVCWISNGALPVSLRTLLQEWTEERLQVLAEDLWSLKSAVHFLRVCRAALAPGNSVRQVSKEEGQAALHSVLYKCFPGWMQLLVGSTEMKQMIATIQAALYEEPANQQLLLNFSLVATYAVLSIPNNSSFTPAIL